MYRCLIVGLGASHTLGSGALAKIETSFRFTERSMHGSDVKNEIITIVSERNSCHPLKQSPRSANKLLPGLPT